MPLKTGERLYVCRARNRVVSEFGLNANHAKDRFLRELEEDLKRIEKWGHGMSARRFGAKYPKNIKKSEIKCKLYKTKFKRKR